MRNRLWAIVLVAAGIAALPSHAASVCQNTAQEVATLEWDDMEDILFAPECAALREPIAERIDEMLASGDWPEDADEDGLEMLATMATGMRISAALWRQDVPAARGLIAGLQRQFDDIELAMLEEEAAEAEAEEEQEAAESYDEPDEDYAAALLTRVTDVLDGKVSNVLIDRLPSPAPEWKLSMSRCGTGTAMFVMGATIMPTQADAWVAIGAPEIGLQSLLIDQWVAALSMRMTPPRLREFAERAFGAGAYETEVELALAGIRIENTVSGRQAGMPLFGLWVPVPLGTDSWIDENDLRFEHAQDIAAYLRPRLLSTAE